MKRRDIGIKLEKIDSTYLSGRYYRRLNIGGQSRRKRIACDLRESLAARCRTFWSICCDKNDQYYCIIISTVCINSILTRNCWKYFGEFSFDWVKGGCDKFGNRNNTWSVFCANWRLLLWINCRAHWLACLLNAKARIRIQLNPILRHLPRQRSISC